VLIGRIQSLIEQEQVLPARILAITFTSKAAGEMRRRLAQSIGEKAALVHVSTFHSLGVQMLKRFALELGGGPQLHVQDELDSLARVRAVMKELGHPLNLRQERPSEVLGRISLAKSWMVRVLAHQAKEDPSVAAQIVQRYQQGDPALWQLPTAPGTLNFPDRDRWAGQFSGYQGRLQAERLVDYDDLLALPVLLCVGRSAVREAWAQQWDWVLVDEYQDTDEVQELLLEQLCLHHKNLMVVGDPAQAIYSWRGARVENIRDFASRWNATTIALTDNYRSSPEILEAANASLQARSGEVGSVVRLRTRNPSGEAVRVWHCQTQEVEAALVARELQKIKRGGRLKKWRDVFVLYRLNRVVRALELALKREGIPYRIANAVALHEAQDARPLISLLRLIVNPWDTQALEYAIPAIAGPGVVTHSVFEQVRSRARTTVTPMLTVLQDRPETVQDLKPSVVEAFRHTAEFVAAARERVAEAGVPAMLTAVVGDLGILDRLVTLTAAAEAEDDEEAAQAGEERMQQLQDLMLYIEEACQRRPDIAFDAQLVLEDLVVRAPGDGWREWMDGNGDAVTLMSIHAAKGLEAPWVWVVGLEEGVFPVRSTGTEANARLGEEARLFYVALTRAERHLVLSSSRTREIQRGDSQPRLPSRFLGDLPETTYRLEYYGGQVLTDDPSSPDTTILP